jgi:hypothetical protein
VLRFLLFGCGGFYVMLLGAVAFVLRVFDGDGHMMSWPLSLPLALVGVFMVLYGVGEWRRWGYLLVFLSIPATFIACAFADSLLFPHNGKEHVPFALLITGLAAFFTLAAVRTYYQRRAEHQTPTQSHETDAD